MKFILVLIILHSSLVFAKGFVPSSFSSNFEQTVKSVTGKEQKTFGKIDYKYPGQLRFEVIGKTPLLFVVNPQKTWLYQPAFVKGEKDQVTIQKSSNLPIIKFLDSVKDGLQNSKLFTTKNEKNDLVLTFVKTIQKEMGFAEVILHADRPASEVKELKGFQSLTLKHLNKSQTKLKLIDLKENATFPPGNFEFVPSANTKIIKN